MLQYAFYLKSLYTREKLLTYDKWPQVRSKKYINPTHIEKENITKQEAHQIRDAAILGNIDNIKQSKQTMDIGQIAQLLVETQSVCILVEGEQGIGKSTFAWKLCRKWGKGKLLQQYQLVVLLRLRDNNVRAAKNIFDLFQFHHNQIQRACRPSSGSGACAERGARTRSRPTSATSATRAFPPIPRRTALPCRPRTLPAWSTRTLTACPTRRRPTT